MSFVLAFRQKYGRNPTEKELEEILRGFGIEPDANGNYRREQFEMAWHLMDEGITDDKELKKRLAN